MDLAPLQLPSSDALMLNGRSKDSPDSALLTFGADNYLGGTGAVREGGCPSHVKFSSKLGFYPLDANSTSLSQTIKNVFLH